MRTAACLYIIESVKNVTDYKNLKFAQAEPRGQLSVPISREYLRHVKSRAALDGDTLTDYVAKALLERAGTPDQRTGRKTRK